MKILIVGVVKDVANVLSEQVAILNNSFKEMGSLSWYLVESDSSDSTVDVLENCRSKYDNFEYIALGALKDSLPERTKRLAYCRNKYIEVLEGAKYADFDYVVVADFDAANTLLTSEKISQVFSLKSQWDVLTANQLGPYYDLWALRHPLWCPVDCDQTYKFLIDLGVHSAKALQVSVLDKMVVIPVTAPLIEVDSAFGGFGIYKKNVLAGHQYHGIDCTGKVVCEHVPLNLSIKKEGHKIFIAPFLTNIAWNEHSRRKSVLYRVLRSFKAFVRSCCA